MKNKKKSLNPNKFWLYQGYLPKTQTISWNYLLNYKASNQITLFMENLNSRNFNLLIRQVKQNKFKYRKHLSLFLFNMLYFNFIKILLLKFIKNKSFLKFLLFYLLYLKQYIIVRKMNLRSLKARLKKYKRKKKIKEHYLRAVPRHFKDFYLIKQQSVSLKNIEYYKLYCLSSISSNAKKHFAFNTNRFSFRLVWNYYKYYAKNKLFLNYLVMNTFTNSVYLQRLKKKYIYHWIRQRMLLLYYYSLSKLNIKQIQRIVYYYYWFLVKKVKKSKFFLLKRLKYNYFRFWFLFYKKRSKSYKKLFGILKRINKKIYQLCAGVLIKSVFVFHGLLLEDKNHWCILYNELLKTFFLKKLFYMQASFLVNKDNQILYKKINTVFAFSLLKSSRKQISSYNLYQIKINQLLFIQKFLENFFTYRLNNPILIRLLNLFVLHKKKREFRKLFPVKKREKSKKNKFFFEGVKTFLSSLYFNDPSIFAKYIAYRLQQTGRRQKHSKTISDIFYLVRLMRTVGIDIAGFQILLCGKVNANTQTQVKYLKWGPDLRTNTFSKPLHYFKTKAVTYTGVFGIHVWFIKK